MAAVRLLPLILAGLGLLLSPGRATYMPQDGQESPNQILVLEDPTAARILESRLLQLKSLIDRELSSKRDAFDDTLAEESDAVDSEAAALPMMNSLHPMFADREEMSPLDLSLTRGKKSSLVGNYLGSKARRLDMANLFNSRGRRIPSHNHFFGARGKRQPVEGDFVPARGERAPPPHMAFAGARGKKEAPTGFSFARGKKESSSRVGNPAEDQRQSLLDNMKYYMQLRSSRDVHFADNGFKKRQPPNGFSAVRGKRDVTQ